MSHPSNQLDSKGEAQERKAKKQLDGNCSRRSEVSGEEGERHCRGGEGQGRMEKLRCPMCSPAWEGLRQGWEFELIKESSHLIATYIPKLNCLHKSLPVKINSIFFLWAAFLDSKLFQLKVKVLKTQVRSTTLKKYAI